MLKIKEDKMHELEKLGFKKCEAICGDIYFYDIYKNYDLYIEIEVMTDRTITLDIYCDEVWTDELDILWELFTNNMVEKVDE